MENKATVAGALLVGGLFLAALYHLLSLQFESGEAYPPYSSFRTDPIGTSALFEALGALDGLSVRRNLARIESIGPGVGRTLLFAGSTISDDPESVIEALETFADEGGRLVIAFSADSGLKKYLSDKEDAEADEEEDSPPADENAEAEIGSEDGTVEDESESREDSLGEDEAETDRDSFLAPMVSIAERWGFCYGTRNLWGNDIDKHGEHARRTKAADETLPEALTAIHKRDRFGSVVIEADADPTLRHAYPYDHRVFVMPIPSAVHDVFRDPSRAALELQRVLDDTQAFASEIFGLFDDPDDDEPSEARPELTPATARGFMNSPLGDELATRIQLQPPYHGLIESDVVVVNSKAGEPTPQTVQCLKRIEKLLERVRSACARDAELFLCDPCDRQGDALEKLLAALEPMCQGGT